MNERTEYKNICLKGYICLCSVWNANWVSRCW